MTVLPQFGHLSGGLLNNRISWFCWLVFVSCQYFWFARGEAGEDVVPLLLVNNCSGDIGLQLSHFWCHSVSDQVLRHHLKVMQTRRECWVVMLQLSVSIHDLGSPLQKERIPTYYPVHANLWKNFVLSTQETEQGEWSKIFHKILRAKLCSCQPLNCPLFSVKTAR